MDIFEKIKTAFSAENATLEFVAIAFGGKPVVIFNVQAEAFPGLKVPLCVTVENLNELALLANRDFEEIHSKAKEMGIDPPYDPTRN